jgi:hypothetical protein
MKRTLIACGVIAWLSCGFINSGYDYSYWQHDYMRLGLKPPCGAAWPGVAFLMPFGAEGLGLMWANGMTQDGWELHCDAEQQQAHDKVGER